METIKKYQKYIILTSAIILLGVFVFIYYHNIANEEEIIATSTITTTTLKTSSTTSSKLIYVDVKGEVKKAGVYSFNEGDLVIDAINKAGGLTKNGVTTNINLSQKLRNEMVIYIFSKKELTTSSTTNPITTAACKCETIEVNNCISTTTTTSVTNSSEESVNNLININTATIDDLIKLSGIGESKAKAIIDYRTEHGLFNSIEDIMNVSGLGEALFAKIKDYITV